MMDLRSTNSRSPSASPSDTRISVKTSVKDHRRNNSRVDSNQTAGRLACDICRERKVRCDREDPKCGRCSRLGHDCSYHGRAKHGTSQAHLSRQLLEIQDRLAQAEARLTMPVSSPPTPDITTATEIPWPCISLQEPSLENENSTPVLNPMAMMQPNYSGFDIFANFASEGRDFSGNELDWTSMVPPLSDIRVAPESFGFQTPIKLSRQSIDVSASRHNTIRDSPSRSSEGSEELLLQNISLLHRNYFETFFPVMPILGMRRFFAELANDSSSSQIRSLSCATALIGTTVSRKYEHMQQICYNLARKHVELCERDEDGREFASLNVFQALLFNIRFELTSKRVTRAWMTLGRAVRLANMLNLHQMDKPNSVGNAASDLQICLPSTEDLACLEERRRSFWALYIFEAYASRRTGMPCQLAEAEIFVALPSPGSLTQDFTPSPMPLLSDISKFNEISKISSYTGIVLMVALSRLTYNHVEGPTTSIQNAGFWDRHYALVRTANERSAMLHMRLNARAVREDPVAFGLHINLCAVDIYLHEAAIDEADKQGLSKAVSAESKSHSTAAAFKIASAVRVNWPAQRSECDIFTLQATFIAWPVVMGIRALGRTLQDSEDATANGTADSLRLLLTALDQVEEVGGYWHNSITGVVNMLEEWDEKQGGSHVRAWNATHFRRTTGQA